jgi:hypothetical protein
MALGKRCAQQSKLSVLAEVNVVAFAEMLWAPHYKAGGRPLILLGT